MAFEAIEQPVAEVLVIKPFPRPDASRSQPLGHHMRLVTRRNISVRRLGSSPPPATEICGG